MRALFRSVVAVHRSRIGGLEGYFCRGKVLDAQSVSHQSCRGAAPRGRVVPALVVVGPTSEECSITADC